MRIGCTIGLVLALTSCAAARNQANLETWHHGAANGQALVCRPHGVGPFPVVLFNHGLIVDRAGLSGARSRGYDLAGLCQALAQEGFLGFFPIRQSGMRNLPGHATEVADALDAVKARPDADANRVALAGFSRGGLLALMVGVRRDDYRALVLLAPAPGRNHFRRAVAQISNVKAPILVMIEAGDQTILLKNLDLLERSARNAGTFAEIRRYDRGGGHRLFWDIGYYWPHLTEFLTRHLAP